MTLNPLLPLWVLIITGLLLLAWVGYCFVQANRRVRMLWLGRAGMVIALFCALLRPGIGSVPTEVADESVDVLFVVDMSASAAAEDWDAALPRLEGMRQDIASLAQQHPGARYSIVSFGSSAVQRLPFTTDATALEQSLSTMLPEESRFSSGTSVSAPVDLVTAILESAATDYPDRARVVYYLGDGEQTADEQPASFTSVGGLIQGGSVLGYGTVEGGRMIEYDRYGPTGDYITTRDGDEAISELEEENLVTIADQLAVPYELRSAADDVTAAEVNPGRGQSLDNAATQLTTFPLYWIFGLVVLSWLFVEVWALGRTAGELRAARELVE